MKTHQEIKNVSLDSNTMQGINGIPIMFCVSGYKTSK